MSFNNFLRMCKRIIFVLVLCAFAKAAPPEYYHHPLHDESIPIVKKFEEGVHAVEDSFYSGNECVRPKKKVFIKLESMS